MVGGLIPGTLFSLAVRVAPDDGTVSTTVGWMQQWSAFGQFAGPPLAAWAAARCRGWHVIWWVTAAFGLAGLCVAGMITRFLAGHPAHATARAGRAPKNQTIMPTKGLRPGRHAPLAGAGGGRASTCARPASR